MLEPGHLEMPFSLLLDGKHAGATTLTQRNSSCSDGGSHSQGENELILLYRDLFFFVDLQRNINHTAYLL